MAIVSKLNAVLLVGDRRASIKIRDDNKGFLELKGIPLFVYVLKALLRADYIQDVVLVGPSKRLALALETHASILDGCSGAVKVVEQRDNMIDNFKAGYVASLGLEQDIKFWDLKGTKYEQVPVLVSPCDIPLLTAAEVDEFIQSSNMYEYDYSIGISSEKLLSNYYPSSEKKGVRMIYFHVKEDLLRHNNLHIGRPLKFEHLDYVEKMYEWRYQTRLVNIVRTFFSLLFSGWRLLKGLRIFILMQLSLYYDRHGHPSLSDRLRSLVCFNRLAEGIGNALGTRVQVIYTHFGGASIDVDKEIDLAAVEERYDEWMKYQEGLLD